VSVVQDPADLRCGLAGLGRVRGGGAFFQLLEPLGQVRLPVDVYVDGPLGDETLKRGKVGSLPRLVGGLIQLSRESGE
jgi:hypothetical protein